MIYQIKDSQERVEGHLDRLNTKSFLDRTFPRYTLYQLIYNSIVHKPVNLVSDVADQTKPQPQSIIQDTTSFNLANQALIPIVRNRDRVHAAETLSHTHKRNEKIKQ